MAQGKSNTPASDKPASGPKGAAPTTGSTPSVGGSEHHSRARTIVFVCPRNDKASASVSDPFMLTVIGQIGDVLSKHNCEMLIATFNRGEHDWKEKYIDSGRADGVIVFGHGTFPESINLLDENNVPFVVWGSTAGDNHYCTVGSDNQRGGYLATSHLLEQGRRRIAFLGDYTLPEITERYLGYRTALNEYAAPLDESLIVKTHPEAYSTFDSIYNHLVEKNIRFDGIVASTDVIAMESVTVLNKLGVNVPNDVAVVGYDDIPAAASFDPPLTTVTQDVNFAAREMVTRLFQLIENKPATSLQLPVKLVERRSSRLPIVAHGFITVSSTGLIEFVDPTAEKIIGCPSEELASEMVYTVFPTKKSHPELMEVDWAELSDKRNHGVEQHIQMLKKDGTLFAATIIVSADMTKDDGMLSIVFWDESESIEPINLHESVERAVAERTEQLAREARRMEKLAFEDPLTGVANRRQFDRFIAGCMKEAKSTVKPLALSIFDVDFFKSYNDNYGHIAGDTCLRRVAQLLDEIFTEKGYLLARYGGEEFAVVMPNASLSQALQAVELALQTVREENITHEYSMVADHVTLSAGVYACIPPMSMQPENLVWMADKALYEAKGGGRNRAFVDPHSNTDAAES